MDYAAGLQALIGNLTAPAAIASEMRRELENLRGLRTKDMRLTEKWKEPLGLLFVACSIDKQLDTANKEIEKVFATMQSDSELQETLMLSCFAAGKWVECFQLAKDLLATRPSPLSYQVALHLSCNRFFMPQYALHLATRACELYPEVSEFKYAETVAMSLCGDAAVYYSEKQFYWRKAAEGLMMVSHPKKNFQTAMVMAQLGNFEEALNYASKGLIESDAPELSALLALIKVYQEDFSEADSFIKNALLRHSGNLLLHTVSFLIQYELYKIVHTNKELLEKRALRLLQVTAGEVIDNSSSNGTEERHGGLSPIAEESANIAEGEQQDPLKRLDFNLDNAETREIVTLCTRILIECELKARAEPLLAKMPKEVYLHTLFEYLHGPKKTTEASLVLMLEGCPESPHAQELLSKVLFSLGKKEQSMAAAKLALKLGGPRRESLTLIGNLYLEGGLYEKAAEMALAALRTHDTYFHIIPKWL